MVLLGAILLYGKTGAGWGRFAALFLLPDLSLLGYLAGSEIGARVYNTVHSSIGPLALFSLGSVGVLPASVVPFALIWWAHTGFDRAVGYGLKYGTGFGHTHLSTFEITRRSAAAQER